MTNDVTVTSIGGLIIDNHHFFIIITTCSNQFCDHIEKRPQEFSCITFSGDGNCIQAVALRGSPERQGQRHWQSPEERDTCVLEDYLQKILRKNQGRK
jgi:hypothetical protein